MLHGAALTPPTSIVRRCHNNRTGFSELESRARIPVLAKPGNEYIIPPISNGVATLCIA